MEQEAKIEKLVVGLRDILVESDLDLGDMFDPLIFTLAEIMAQMTDRKVDKGFALDAATYLTGAYNYSCQLHETPENAIIQ